jgi:hypothetical protein
VRGLQLFLQTDISIANTILTFGVKDIRDRFSTKAWKTLAITFLDIYLSEKDLVIRIENAPQYDWYTGYFADHGVKTLVIPGTNGLIRIYARPDKNQLSLLLKELIADEVWDIGGLLKIFVIWTSDHAALDELCEGATVWVCSVADGQAIEWTGPVNDAPGVQALIQGLVADSGAVLVSQG